jgi:two-component system, cell cycle sensor histidine kinase and response regulator CckA
VRETRPFYLLLIEDSPGDSDLACERIAKEHGRDFEVTRAATLEQAGRALERSRFDLVLLDLDLPDSKVDDTLDWAQQRSGSTAIVVLSGDTRSAVRRRAHRAGVQDFIGKDEPPAHLLARSILYAIERHRAQEQQRQMQRLVAATPDAVIVADTYGTVRFVNDAALELFGRRREDFVGELLGFSVQSGRNLEIEVLRSDGKRSAEMHVVPVEWQGEPALLASIRDVTERNKLREQLRHSQKMEAIGTMAGGIAHEINNVLAVIAGSATLARADRPPGDPVHEALAEIEKAVARGAEVVRQILTFSRREEAALPEVVDVAVVVEEGTRFLRAALPANVEIVTACSPALPAVRANPTEIHQILMNLGANAAHAMRGGGGRLEILAEAVTVDTAAASLSAELRPGRYVRVSVRDTGKGMDTETLDRAFEPFFTTKSAGEGTGLGLAVVHGIVKSHGGAITVYSEPGKGTVLHLYLPAADAVVAAAPAAAAQESAGRVGRILFVDDEQSIVSLYTRLLRRLGFEVRGFHRPAEAVAAFRADPDGFDVVITDLSMPRIDGPALVEEVLEVRPGTPIIMATGYIGDEDFERARRLGVRELVRKPYSMEVLGDVLYRVLGGGDGSPAAPTEPRRG